MFSPELAEQIDCLQDATRREHKKKRTLKQRKRSANKLMTFLAINSKAIQSLHGLTGKPKLYANDGK